MKNNDEKIYYLSYLRVIACVAIIWLHTFTMEAMFYKNDLSTFNNIASNTVPFIMMWAVPCFVMVTGALLLNLKKEITIKKIICRYVLRIVIVLVVFVSIFTICDVIANKEKIGVVAIVKRIIYKFYTGTSWAHLWYLYLLIGLYLLLPAFRALIKGLDDKGIKYILLIYFIFNSIAPLINQVSKTQTGFYLTTNSIFPFYLITGYMIHSDRIKLNMKKSVALLTVGELLIIALSVVGIKSENSVIISLLGNYSFVPVVITSIGIFGTLKNMNINKSNKLILLTDKLSFGIYLTHLVFLRYGIRFAGFNPYTHGGVIMIVVIVLLVFVLSYLLTFILKLIPGLKKIL